MTLPTLSLAARLRIALTRLQARHVVVWDPSPEPSWLDARDAARYGR